MKSDDALSLSDCPCAMVRVSKDREILWANDYFAETYDWSLDDLRSAGLASLFSRASQIFCDSYVYPKLFAEGFCKEVQLTILTSTGGRRPVVASVKKLSDGSFAWVLIEAEDRDSLFQELEEARKALQLQKEQFARLALIDGLTGVANRRGLDDGVKRLFADAERHLRVLSVAVIDVDSFKSINDCQGHQIGDEVLHCVGHVLQATCRKGDLIGRLGGDEFACVLNNVDAKGAKALCERIHAAIAEGSVRLGGFTVSIGVAERSAVQPLDWPTMLSRADAALYKAKQSGRNTTFAYT